MQPSITGNNVEVERGPVCEQQRLISASVVSLNISTARLAVVAADRFLPRSPEWPVDDRLDSHKMGIPFAGIASLLDPQNASLQNSIGDFNLKRRKLGLAQQAFAKALAIDPSFVAARIGQGDVFVAERDFDHALSRYETALQTSPKSTNALVKIGVLQELKGHWNKAEQALPQGVGHRPEVGRRRQ